MKPFLSATTWLLLAGLIAVWAGGCVAEPLCNLSRGSVGSNIADGIGKQEPYIVDGTVSTDRRATIFVQGEEGRCTGVVVGEYTVLTAAHCSKSIKVCFEGGECYDVADQETHPDFRKWKGPHREDRGDLRILYFTEPLPGPYAIIAEPTLMCYPGMIAQGYGRDDNGKYGKLHETLVYETHHNKYWVFTDRGPCFGDSGSPLYVETLGGLEIVGILSQVWAKDCDGGTINRRGSAGYVNLLHYGDWLRERII